MSALKSAQKVRRVAGMSRRPREREISVKIRKEIGCAPFFESA